MERISLEESTIEHAVKRAVEVLRAGGVVLYPTDTLYGLGADALSDAAVEKIYDIKGRDEKKPIHAIVADVTMAEKYGKVNDAVHKLAERFGGAVTLIVEKMDTDSGILRGVETFGFRIPNNAFCIAFAKAFGGPITATSANKSGATAARRVEDILAQLGLSAQAGESAQKIDLIIDAGELPERKPSTVVDCSGPSPKILREGAVSASDIDSVL